MRNFFGAMGVVCGMIIVVLVARYGFKTTDDPIDAWVVAFLYGVIATFGLGGHAFAVYLWRYSKLAAAIAGLIAFVALGINLSNSLGAIAGRQDAAQHERDEKNRKIRVAEAEVKRLTGLRDAMPDFEFADDATVTAARRAADAATGSREAECAKRGDRCRDREADERKATEALAAATANKAASERASKLEADAEAQRAELKNLGPIVTVNVQGSAISTLFRLPEDEAGFASMVQQFGIGAVAELIILICLSGWEVSRPKVRARSSAVPVAPEPISTVATSKITGPKLITSNQIPVGSVSRILADNLKSAQGQQVELAESAKRYRDICRMEGRRTVSQDRFIELVMKFCEDVGLKWQTTDDHLFLMDVQLVDGMKLNSRLSNEQHAGSAPT